MRHVICREALLLFAAIALLCASCAQRTGASEPPNQLVAQLGEKLSDELRRGEFGPYGQLKVEGRIPVLVEIAARCALRRPAGDAALHLLVWPDELLDLAGLSCVRKIELDRDASLAAMH